jgi:hypothetical protein
MIKPETEVAIRCIHEARARQVALADALEAAERAVAELRKQFMEAGRQQGLAERVLMDSVTGGEEDPVNARIHNLYWRRI